MNKMEHFYSSIPGWSEDHMQGELIRFIINHNKSNPSLKIAEIGVYMGRCTALWNVELLNSDVKNYEYFAIDHFKGSSEHVAWNSLPDYDKAINYLGPVIDKIKIIKADSVSCSNYFTDGYFDVVYIDASHEYEFVKKDILAWLPKVKVGGLLCGDDYHPTWSGVIEAVDEIFENNKIVIGNTQWIHKK